MAGNAGFVVYVIEQECACSQYNQTIGEFADHADISGDCLADAETDFLCKYLVDEQQAQRYNETGNLQQLVHSAVNYTQHNANGYAADDEAGNSHCVSERTSYHCSNDHSRCAAEIEHTNCVGKAHCISQSCRDNGLRQNNLQRMEAVIIYAGSQNQKDDHRYGKYDKYIVLFLMQRLTFLHICSKV